jgi:hypothetical protein
MSKPKPSRPEQGLAAATRRKSSFLQTMRAVAWSFFGVRKGAEHDRDMQQLNPVHVIIAGVIGALLFITLLIFVVQIVVGSAAAPT